MDAVSAAGSPIVSSGSQSAMAGYICTPPIATFSFLSSSVKTDQRLTSLPVPAVVGIATTGRGWFLTLCNPT